MTITAEELRTAAKVLREKGFANSADTYLEEAAQIEEQAERDPYIAELINHAQRDWDENWRANGKGYCTAITEAVVAKLTEDGHLRLLTGRKLRTRRELDPSRKYVDCDGDKVEYVNDRWQRYDPVNNQWYSFYTDQYAPYTLVR